MLEAAATLPAAASPAPPRDRGPLQVVPGGEAALASLQGAPGTPPLVPATPRLEIPAYDLAAALELERELRVSHAFAQVLVRRGLRDARAAREFLDAAESHDPSAFAGIERALEAIERQIARGGRITVHGDYDVDGVCATATLVRALRDRGAD